MFFPIPAIFGYADEIRGGMVCLIGLCAVWSVWRAARG